MSVTCCQCGGARSEFFEATQMHGYPGTRSCDLVHVLRLSNTTVHHADVQKDYCGHKLSLCEGIRWIARGCLSLIDVEGCPAVIARRACDSALGRLSVFVRCFKCSVQLTERHAHALGAAGSSYFCVAL